MKSATNPDQIAGGVDQRYFPAANAALDIQNFRYSSDGGWRNDRGWEPLIADQDLTLTDAEFASITAPCRFLQTWTRHGGSEEYYVQERDGELFYEFGNKGTAATRKHTIATGRHLPRSDEPGTQMIPYGRFAMILNGHNEMLKWWGRDLVEPFGFTSQTQAPYIAEVQTDYYVFAGLSATNLNGTSLGDSKNNSLNGIALQFFASDYLGLGDPDQGSINFYSYFVTYITDTGSESPRSGPASISWKITSEAESAEDPLTIQGNARKYGVLLSGLEPGPTGTVARRIYRTKNKRDGMSGAGDVYYFVSQINDNTTTTLIDAVPDNELVNEAPSASDSVTISSSYKYGATWNGSTWLAGGDVLPTRIIYSKQGLPEQFGGFDYFDVGVREGGAITALFPYYDVLLVFRERSIEAVFTGTSGYTCTTINQTIGTIATGSIVLVPGVGVMFMNKDGFYLVAGGLRGGASLSVTHVSAGITKEVTRVNVNALCRASATYSERENEYWCNYPVDGNTENTHGAVYNVITNEWAFRGDTSETIENEWPISRLATDSSGWILLGLNPANDLVNETLYPGIGIQVWSARNALGDTLTYSYNQGIYTLTSFPNPLTNCIWQSAWDDYGDDSIKKRILTIELDTLTEGDNGVELQWAQDYSTDFKSAGIVKPQIGDYIGSTVSDPTYDTGSNLAKWDSSKWQDHKVTRMRWDVNTGLVSHFSFRIITSNVIQVIRYQSNIIVGTVKTPNTRAPGARS
jgi:hypothetical protein